MILARVFYLAVIFAVLWTQGYPWVIVSIAAIFLMGNILFAIPLTSSVARLSNFFASLTDSVEIDVGPEGDTPHNDTKNRRRTSK